MNQVKEAVRDGRQPDHPNFVASWQVPWKLGLEIKYKLSTDPAADKHIHSKMQADGQANAHTYIYIYG